MEAGSYTYPMSPAVFAIIEEGKTQKEKPKRPTFLGNLHRMGGVAEPGGSLCEIRRSTFTS